MKGTKRLLAQTGACGLLASLALVALTPSAALADRASQQKNKNDWRNLAIAGAAVAGYGLLNHNNTATLLGAAGGAYSANRYEQDRRHQSERDNDWSSRRYDRGSDHWRDRNDFYRPGNRDFYRRGDRDRDYDRHRDWDDSHHRGGDHDRDDRR